MQSVFLDFNLPNATTWFYLSGLLAVAIFFKFNRFLSLRNWDLITLFALVPGLLLLQRANADPTANFAAHGLWLGYLWLLAGSAYFFVRCLVDLALVRRPALEPNLNRAGLAWLIGTLLVCLGGVAVRKTPEPEVGKGSAVLDKAQSAAAEIVTQTAGEPIDGRGTRFWVERSLAGLCHLAVVAALIVIGLVHFQDAAAGLAAATLYLLLPYIAYHVTQIHHVWPTAFLLWAVAAYRRPTVAGLLVGVAVGSLFFPAVTLPVWFGFYWGRGAKRFLGGLLLTCAACLTLAGLLLWLDGSLAENMQRSFNLFDWQPWKVPNAQSFWTGFDAYRIPVFIGYALFALMTAFWPSPKTLAHLVALIAANLIGLQLWYADRGGVYVLWYLPLLLLLVFRPNLSDRRPPPVPPGNGRATRLAVGVVGYLKRRLRPPARVGT